MSYTTSRHCKSEDSSVILVALPPKWSIGHLVLFKTRYDLVYNFLTTTNQNKLTSFSHVLYTCHWLIKGGFPAKIDQSLVFPLCCNYSIIWIIHLPRHGKLLSKLTILSIKIKQRDLLADNSNNVPSITGGRQLHTVLAG